MAKREFAQKYSRLFDWYTRTFPGGRLKVGSKSPIVISIKQQLATENKYEM
jgi:hypothetical protein